MNLRGGLLFVWILSSECSALSGQFDRGARASLSLRPPTVSRVLLSSRCSSRPPRIWFGPAPQCLRSGLRSMLLSTLRCARSREPAPFSGPGSFGPLLLCGPASSGLFGAVLSRHPDFRPRIGRPARTSGRRSSNYAPRLPRPFPADARRAPDFQALRSPSALSSRATHQPGPDQSPSDAVSVHAAARAPGPPGRHYFLRMF